MSTNGKTLKFRAAKLKGFTVYPILCIGENVASFFKGEGQGHSHRA